MFSSVVWLLRRVQRLDAGVGGKRVRLDAIERVRAPRHLDVVRDEGPLSHQLVRLDDEAADVPAHDGDDDVADDGRNDGRSSHRGAAAETAQIAAMAAPTISATQTTSMPVRVT